MQIREEKYSIKVNPATRPVSLPPRHCHQTLKILSCRERERETRLRERVKQRVKTHFSP